MIGQSTRREFLADVGRGMLVASVGSALAADMGFASPGVVEGGSDAITFGSLEPLVCLMQETPVKQLLPKLVAQLKAGTELRQLVAAAALANARTFGGEDYVGFHTIMAMSPAYHMALELPAAQQALPVFKVLYRNTNRIQEVGGRKSEVLHQVNPDGLSTTEATSDALRNAVHRRDVNAAERTFAAIAQRSPEEAFNALLMEVQETTEVHRVVLPYRAWDMLDIVGRDKAHTMLRQSVRYCVKSEGGSSQGISAEPRTLLPKLLEQYHLLDKTPGDRQADDAWIDKTSQGIFSSTPEQAAEIAAAALAEGMSPAAVGEAICLAANQLVLRDHGRTPQQENPGKPIGSVHGDSVGVHACDSANAWRNMARVSNTRNTFACLILGAYQVARDRVNGGGDFLNWKPAPVQWHLDQVKSTDGAVLLSEADEAIRGNLQTRAAAIVHRYGQLGLPSRPVFDLMLKYAVSEDGSLHAEKYYRTASDEFASTRSAFRWRQLIALARVTASEYGRPAAGMAEARELLKA